MLEFKNISKRFDSDLLKKPFQALNDVNFIIPEGAIMGFLGANGAGKTTSIKIAMDFIRATEGQICFSGSLGSTKKEAFRKIGYLPERPFFYPHLTGKEFCYYMGLLAEVNRSNIEKQIQKWSPRFKIDFALDREIKTYSKGMLQRLGFLATLLHRPHLIILDEPLSGLDPIGRKELKEIIVEVNKEGATIFFSSHIVSDVEAVCDSVIFMKNGQVIFDGSVDKIISENKNGQSAISYIDSGELRFTQVDDSVKSKELAKLLENGHEIISVEPKTPTLEEIFYTVR